MLLVAFFKCHLVLLCKILFTQVISTSITRKTNKKNVSILQHVFILMNGDLDFSSMRTSFRHSVITQSGTQ